MNCDVIYTEIFRTWRHSLDFTYAQKTRIKSKVIRNKKYKGIPKSVIKGVLKGKIKGDDTGDVIKARNTPHIRDAKHCT